MDPEVPEALHRLRALVPPPAPPLPPPVPLILKKDTQILEMHAPNTPNSPPCDWETSICSSPNPKCPCF